VKSPPEICTSLVETCKLNDIDPQACFADVLSRIVSWHHRPESMTCSRGTMPGYIPKQWHENSAYKEAAKASRTLMFYVQHL
jgi:hypothetical protein